MAVYDYVMTAVNSTKLTEEILDQISSPVLQSITAEVDEDTGEINVEITFDGDLTAEQKTTLDGIVAAHVADTTFDSAQHASSPGEESTSSGTWVEKLALQSDKLKHGDYLFTWYCEIKTDGLGVAAQVTYNGNEQGFTSWGESQYHAFSGSVVASMKEGNEPLIVINYRVLGSGPVYIRRARLSISLMDRE